MNYFVDGDLLKAKKQKTLLLIIFLITAAAFTAFLCVMFFVVYMGLPYGSDKILLVKIITYAVILLFVGFCFVYLGLPYKRAKKFCVFLTNLKTGLKEKSVATFLEADGELHEKDGVDCKSLVFIEWNKYKKDYFERRVLVFYEREFPVIPEKAEVEFITQGNFLISYEIKNVDTTVEEKNESDNNGNR